MTAMSRLCRCYSPILRHVISSGNTDFVRLQIVYIVVPGCAHDDWQVLLVMRHSRGGGGRVSPCASHARQYCGDRSFATRDCAEMCQAKRGGEFHQGGHDRHGWAEVGQSRSEQRAGHQDHDGGELGDLPGRPGRPFWVAGPVLHAGGEEKYLQLRLCCRYFGYLRLRRRRGEGEVRRAHVTPQGGSRLGTGYRGASLRGARVWICLGSPGPSICYVEAEYSLYNLCEYDVLHKWANVLRSRSGVTGIVPGHREKSSGMAGNGHP